MPIYLASHESFEIRAILKRVTPNNSFNPTAGVGLAIKKQLASGVGLIQALGPMEKPLDRLVGMALLAAEADETGAGLQFTGCVFSAYSQYSSSRPLPSLIGLSVQSVAYSPEDALTINFSTGESFRVSLQPSDYIGPEAFCAQFAEGPWVIE